MRTINGKTYNEMDKHDIKELEEIITILRSDVGCEWDKAQTLETMKECLQNETKEVLDAIDKKDYENLKEELGDVLLQVIMQSEIAKEKGLFTFSDVVQGVAEKLIRRHPHVFGDVEKPKNDEEALAIWRSVKLVEKARKEKNK